MVLGYMPFNEKTVNLKGLNILFIRDCRAFIRSYRKSRNYADDNMRLDIIGEFIKKHYSINKDITDILLELTLYLKIQPNHELVLDTGAINNTPVSTLYKLIKTGNLSLRGVPIFKKAFQYALLKKNWRELNGH